MGGKIGVVEIGGAVVAVALWSVWVLMGFFFFFSISLIWVDMDDGGVVWRSLEGEK